MSSYAKDVFIVNRWMLKVAGLWVPDSSSKLIQIFYKVYSVFMLLIVYIYFPITEFVTLFNNNHHLHDFIKNINLFLSHLMGITKVIFWLTRGHAMKRLMAFVENDEFQYENSENYNPGKISNDYKKVGIIYTVFFCILGHVTMFASYIPPLISAILIANKGNSTSFNMTMPYFSWMPFKHDEPLTYILSLIYQCAFGVLFCYCIAGVDCLFMNLMNMSAAHFKILHGAFRTIKLRSMQKIHRDKYANEELKKTMNLEMKKCCRHLQATFRVCENLEFEYQFVAFFQANASLLLLCTSLYLISTTPVTNNQFTSQIIYMFGMIFQLFLYCWFGNEVTLMAELIPSYIWECDWIDADSEFKQHMIFTMKRMRKPVYMTIGKFAPLTLQTFVQICKGSYSIFAVIKNSR